MSGADRQSTGAPLTAVGGLKIFSYSRVPIGMNVDCRKGGNEGVCTCVCVGGEVGRKFFSFASELVVIRYLKTNNVVFFGTLTVSSIFSILEF